MEKSIPEEPPITFEEICERLGMEQLPREDAGRYWIDRWSSKDGKELARYVNKKTNVVERRVLSRNEVLIGETLFNKETGKPKETKSYDENGRIDQFIDYETIEEDEKTKILMDTFLIDNLVAEEKLMGRDPDLKH